MFYKNFQSVDSLTVIFLVRFLEKQKCLILKKSEISNLAFINSAFGEVCDKCLPISKSQRFF